MARFDLTDKEWAIIEPLLPTDVRGKARVDDRRVLSGSFWRLRTGRTYGYRSQRPDDAAMRERLKALANERRRFGYRRLHILLRHEGLEVNHEKLFRLYREERLTVRRSGGRKRAIGTRAPMTLPHGPSQRLIELLAKSP